MPPETVDRVSRRFVRYLETGAEPEAVFTEDVFLDFTLPQWRLQAQGLADVHAVRLRGHPATGTVSRWSAHPTPTGFAMEAEERWRDAKSDWYCREAFFAELRGDRPGLALLGGVLLAAWLRFAGYLQLPFLLRTFTADVGHHREVSYGRSALVGGAFALGWTPCIGPILGSILTLAGQSSNAWTGAYLLVAYSAGFSIPFLVTGLMLSDSQKIFRKIAPYSGIIEVASAVMLLSVGVLLYYGRLTGLNSFFGFSDFNQGL